MLMGVTSKKGVEIPRNVLLEVEADVISHNAARRRSGDGQLALLSQLVLIVWKE
jgi:hypothetical protein